MIRKNLKEVVKLNKNISDVNQIKLVEEINNVKDVHIFLKEIVELQEKLKAREELLNNIK